MSNHSGFEKEMIYDNGNSNGTNLVRANEELRKLNRQRTEIKREFHEKRSAMEVYFVTRLVKELYTVCTCYFRQCRQHR